MIHKAHHIFIYRSPLPNCSTNKPRPNRQRKEKKMRTYLLTLLVVLISLSIFPSTNEANMQTKQLEKLLKFSKFSKFSNSNFDSLQFSLFDSFSENGTSSSVYVEDQAGLMEKDKIFSLPGQPNVNFSQYSGYVYLDSKHEEALFYYLVESPQNSPAKPLLLWLNGGKSDMELLNFVFAFKPLKVFHRDFRYF